MTCYRMFMPKQPLSVTLERDNLLWLRGRVAAGKRKSLSDALDEILTTARLGGHAADARTVVGTVDIAAGDPGLEQADQDVQELFAASPSRPTLARERSPRVAGRRKPSRG